MARRKSATRFPAPFLERLCCISEQFPENPAYPFNLPWLNPEVFELEFTTPVTIIGGENGAGKSTLIEAIAALSGYDETGSGKGYRPVDHSQAMDRSGAELAGELRGGCYRK